MKTFLWVQLVASAICILAKGVHMTKNEYPRKVIYNLGQDCIGLITLFAMMAWEIWLLGGFQR